MNPNSRMTLAVILVSISLAAPATPSATSVSQDAPQTAPASQPATGTPDQGNTKKSPPAKSDSPSPNSGSAAAKPNPSKHPLKHPRRKTGVSTCNEPSPAAAPADPNLPGSAASVPAPTNPSSGASTSPNPSASAPANCPPSKIIVRQGGSSEPTIQLAGGPVGDQAAQQRANAAQMLEATSENLKKIVGRTLTANQQDMVNEVRKFIEQSKAASTAGDLDRARTLAWKAQLLSEELVKPQK